MLRKEHHALLATLKRDTKRGAFCANGGDGGGGVKEGWGAGRERDEEDGKKMAAYMHTF